MKETGSLFCGHQWSYFLSERGIKKTAGQKALVWININKSSSLFLWDPCSWKQWLVGHFYFPEASVAASAYCFHDCNLFFFVPGEQQVCVIEWRLIDKNNRERCFSIWNCCVEMRHAPPTGRCEYQSLWVWPIGTNGALQWSAPSSPSLRSLAFCILSHSPFFFFFHSGSDDFLVSLQMGSFHAKHSSELEQQRVCIS